MSEPVRLTLSVDLKLCPREGQSPEEARAEFSDLVQHYLEAKDGSFRTDYGADPAEIAAARERGEAPVWGGYDGPVVTDVAVRPSVV